MSEANDYDRFLASRGTSSTALQTPLLGDATYEQALSEGRRSRRTDFIMRQGLATDRSRAQRMVRLYERTGLDLGLLTTHLDEIEQQTQMADFDAARFRRESPLVAAWAEQSPQHAAVTWADADALTDLESTLTPDLGGLFPPEVRQELLRRFRLQGGRVTTDRAEQAEWAQQQARTLSDPRLTLPREALEAQAAGLNPDADPQVAAFLRQAKPNAAWMNHVAQRPAYLVEGEKTAAQWWDDLRNTNASLKLLPFVGGGVEVEQAYQLYTIVQRIDAGTATTNDIGYLLEYDNELRRGSTFATGTLEILSHLPAFGAELYMTGGLYTAGKEAGKKAGFKATKAALRGMLSRRMTGLLARGAGVVLGGAIQGTVALAPRTVADTIRRMTPDLAALEQDDGTIELMTMPGSEDGFGEALAKAAAGSAIEGITERTGAALIGKPLAAIAKRIPMADKLAAMRAMVMTKWLRQNPGSTVRQFAARVAKQTGWDGVIEEIGEEEIGKVLRRIAQVDAQYEFTTPEEFLQQAIAFSVVPGAVGTLDAAFYSKEAAQKAQQQTAFFQAIGDSVKRSQMLATMPEGLQNIVAGITKNGDVETLYQDVQAWNDHWVSQNIDPRAKYIELTGDAAAYDQAAQAGHDLPIPTAAYAVHIAPTDDAKAINRDLRLGPDQPTVRELEQIAAQLAQQARQAEQQAQAEAKATGDASATSGNTSGGVRQDVYNQLLATGASAETASYSADLWESVLQTLGGKVRINPGELYSNYGLRIIRDLPDVLTKISRTDLLDVMLDRLRSGDVPTFETARGLDQASIERRLLDWARQNGLPDATESISDPELREMAQSDRVLAFGGKIPTELRTHFEGRPNVLRLLRSGDSLGRGSDFLADVGFDRYVQMVEELAGGQTAMVEQARELARNAPDPEAQLLAWLLERTPRAEARTSKVMLQTNTLRAGDSFTFEGHAVQVVEDISPSAQPAGELNLAGEVVKDDLTTDQPAPGLLLVGDELSVPVWAIEEIPADDGSIERETPAPGSAPGGSASGAGIAGGGGMAELQALRTVLNQLGVDVGTMDNAAIRELLQQQMQAQPAQGQTLGQAESPGVIEISGAELGEGLSDSEYRKAAKAWAKANLRGTGKNPKAFVNDQTGRKFKLSVRGIGKIISNSADVRRAQMVVAIPELIRVAKYDHSDAPRPKKRPGAADAKAYHYFTARIRIADVEEPVLITIRENFNGEWYYNHNLTEVRNENEKASPVYPGAPGQGQATVPAVGEAVDTIIDQADSEVKQFIDVDGVQRPTTNSQGQPIHPTEDGLRNFWRWFGDSKVVDAEGRPLVVYHGTGSDFTTFQRGHFGDAYYFAGDAAEASAYSAVASRINGGTGSNVIPAYIRIERDGYELLKTPKVQRLSTRDALARLTSDGYDGFHEPGGMYVVFSPEQIKSALGNQGTFDGNDPSILHQPLVIGGTAATNRKRGAITFSPDGQITISLFQKADMSTFLHESGHAFLRIMADLAAHPNATEQLRGDWQAVLKWLGAKPGASVQDLTVEQHEQWARGFEAYLFEGKAPNATLRRAFYRFRQWLLRIYRSISRLGVELTDDIRQVMDRLVAADAEIEAARRETGAGDLFRTQQDALDAGMTVEGYQAYTELAEQAKQQADDQLVQQLMGELTRQRADWWRGEQEATRKEVEAELDQQPIFRALAALQRNRMPDGSRLPEGVRPMKLDAKVLVDQRGKDILKKLPRPYVYTWEGGMHPDEVAELVGFDSGEELVDNLLRARNRKQLIEAEVERLMRERYGDMVMDGSIADKAIEAWHQDRRGELLMHELRTLAGRVRRRTPSLGTLAEQARQQIAGKRARDIRPVLYLRAEAKAAQEAFAALTARDWEAAYRAKSRQILNHALYIAARDAKQEVDAMVRDMARYRKPRTRARLGKVGGNYLQAIDEIMARTEFVRVTQSELDRRLGLREWIAEREAAGDTLGEVMRLPAGLADEARRTNYQERTLAELRDIKQLVDQIEHQAEVKDILLANLEKTQKQNARDELINAAEANFKALPEPPLTNAGLTFRDGVSQLARQFDVQFVKVEQLMDMLDGYRVDGPWHRHFWNPLAKAQAEELDWHKRVNAKIATEISKLSKAEQRRLQEVVTFPGITRRMIRSDLIGVALNCGNESNYDKLLRGMGWSAAQVDAMLDKLTKSEWDVVQAIWDALALLQPPVWQLEKDTNGITPDKVEPREIVTPHGTYAGGYYPLMYDPKYHRVGEAQVRASLGGLLEGNYVRATTPKGHTKARIQEFAAPLDFNIYRLPAHVAGVIKDLTHRRWLLDANWLLQDEDITAVLDERLGPEYVTLLREKVRQVVNDRNVASMQSLSLASKIFRHARYTSMITALGFRFSSMAAQVGDFGRVIDVISADGNDGRQWFKAGLSQFFKAPRGSYQFILEASGEMRHRFETMDRDLRDLVRDLTGQKSLLKQIQEFSLRGLAVFERGIAVPAWLGGYQKARAAGLSHEDAVQAGDRVVRLGLGAGGVKDLAAIQSNSTELGKLVTQFYTPGAVLYNRLRDMGHQVRNYRDLPRLLLRIWWVWIVPVSATLLLKGDYGPDDEDEDWTIWYLRQLGTEPLGAVPVARDMARAWESGSAFKFSPATRLFEDLTKAAVTSTGVAKDVWEGEADGDSAARFVGASYRAAKSVFGLPTGQLEITGGYMLDILQGEDEPEDLGDFLHDLAYPRPRRKEED